ncbi:MAG: C25 family cysteine peptidase [Candidatus Fibromonas sp.]|nr:C25 family cysteine peptidase [Candidatus Fibromonas sp.]
MTFRAVKTLILLPIGIFALEIQRDNQSEFVFTDKVVALSEQPCKNDALFMPENSSFFGKAEAPGAPFRAYTIALPNSSLPGVNLENLKSEKLNGKPCGAEQNPNSIKLGEPYLKDGLWRVKISVPLLYSSGNSWNLRRDFRVRINFGGNANGYMPGKRALSQVENKGAAARFGTGQINSGSRTALKSSTDGIEWLLRIGIGSTDLSTPADGIYAISFDDLEKKNSDPGIKISALRLFSASPDTLTERIGEEEIFPNAEEIPITVKDKNGNGIFDRGDSIVFFGYGTAIWKKSYSQSGMDYYFSSSPYSYYQYFYLGAGGTGSRLEEGGKNAGGARDIVWKKYVRSEKDSILRDNYLGENSIEENTGKEWFWAWGIRNSTVTVNPAEFQNSVRNLSGIDGKSILIGATFFPLRSTPNNWDLPWKEKMKDINFNFFFQEEKLEPIDTVLGGTFVFASEKAGETDNSYKVEISSTRQNDRFDGLSVAYRYNITKSQGNEWLFPGSESGSVKIPVPANVEVEVIKTVNYIPVEILTVANGNAYDIISGEEDTKYFLHRKNSYKKPAFVEAIPNRYSVLDPLKISADCPEYLILTSEVLQSSAVRLKDFRKGGTAPVKLNTSVVLVEDIYRNHGAQKNSPVAIRDYLRYAKNKCHNLKYVLLAGHGNYDYRNIRANSRDNLIPPYETEELSTDDFFAVLDAGETVRFGKYNLSLSVGRLPVSNIGEFDNYIQKVRDYEEVSAMNNGIWRNTIILNADDAMQGNRIDNIKHTMQMERIASLIDSLSQRENFTMDMRKISLLQYEKDGNGKKPEAAKELLLRLNQGALFTMYYGHGNSVQWADEDLLNISSLNNVYPDSGKYTILGSFSCSVARFDDASSVGLSEAFVTAKSKGAIAAIGAAREVYATENVNFSEKILEYSLFNSDNLLGDAIFKVKQSVDFTSTGQRYNNTKYVLLGEPVLSIPRRGISLELNDTPALKTIQALQKLKISGEASVQTGRVRMQVLEGEKSRTLIEKNCNDENYCSASIKIPGNPIYSEELEIKNGKFETEFITPRKLSFGDTSAQIRLWGYKSGTAGIGRMAVNGILLSGTSSYADSINDPTPPSIKIYPCMRSGIANPFAENALIGLEIPACLDVVIEDSTGIDYREEADEGITFEVSPVEDAWHPWPLSEQTGKRAVAKMNFGTSYDPGEYVFKVNAQDILGNAAFRSLRVSLSQENREGLTDVFNVPNPMKKNGTVFYFKNLFGERPSNVRIRIFDQNGKPVKTINNAVSGTTHWDGRDSRGRLLANGLYHYVVQSTVQPSAESGKKKTFEKKQKLIISR